MRGVRSTGGLRREIQGGWSYGKQICPGRGRPAAILRGRQRTRDDGPGARLRFIGNSVEVHHRGAGGVWTIQDHSHQQQGAGDSGRTGSEEDYTVQNFAIDLHNAVSALGLSDFILVGHSMGGATVTQFALSHQDMLRGLVLLNPAPLAGRALADNWEEELRATFVEGGLTRGDMR